MPGARYKWVKYVLPQYISSRVQNPLATVGPHQNWHLDQCWIKSCWTWYDFFKPCWSSPQPKASQASLATLGGSRKSCRRFHETCDLSQFLISAAQNRLIRALSTETFSNVIQLHLSKLCARDKISPPGTLVGSQARGTLNTLRDNI